MSEIIVAGRPNVGKSSIIRQLTGKKVETGKRPGVTREFIRLNLGKNLDIVDLPGFGYIAGISEERQEEIKDRIVRYLEESPEELEVKSDMGQVEKVEEQQTEVEGAKTGRGQRRPASAKY